MSTASHLSRGGLCFLKPIIVGEERLQRSSKVRSSLQIIPPF
jgi:hypothetical protein